MRRNFTFIVLLFSVTLLLSALQKPLFWMWYTQLLIDASLADLGDVIWHGLSLDATFAGYVTAIPILSVLIASWLPHRVWRGLIKWYLVIISLLTAACVSLNLGLYEHWGYPLDSSIFQFLATPKQAMASITLWQAIVHTLLTVAWFSMTCYCYMATLRIFKADRHIKYRFGFSLLMIFTFGLNFLAIRGGLTTAVANVSKAFFSERMVLNHAAVNPSFSLLSSLARTDEMNLYNFFDEERCAEEFASLSPYATTPSEELLRIERPNVVVIIAESCGRSTINAEVENQAVAPGLKRLRNEGVWFENLIASAARTDRGVLATLSGFPAQPTMSIMKHPQKAAQLPSIARTLRSAGYSTHYIHGGDLNFTNMASYLYATGFDNLVALKDMSFDAPTSKWGYADDVVADLFMQKVDEYAAQQSPYLAVWQTLSSHEPFDVPVNQFEDKMLNSMWFADREITRVVEHIRQSPNWENTLIVIIADHAFPYPYGIEANSVIRHRIPMLWLGGAIKQAKQIDQYCSQSDFAATLLAQLGLPHSDFVMSRDILSEKPYEFGYYTFNNGFGVVTERSEEIYDCNANKALCESEPSLIEAGKSILQTTYKIIREL